METGVQSGDQLQITLLIPLIPLFPFLTKINFFLDSKRKELINSLNLQLNRKPLARTVSPLTEPIHICLIPGKALLPKASQGSDGSTVMFALSMWVLTSLNDPSNLEAKSRSKTCSTKNKIGRNHPLLLLFPVMGMAITNTYSVLICARQCAQHFTLILIAALWG